MFKNTDLDVLKERLEEYLQELGVDTSKTLMPCPVCGDTKDFRLRKGQHTWHCFSAKHSRYGNQGGSIIDLYGQVNNLDPDSKDGKRQIIKELGAKYLGMGDTFGIGSRPKPAPKPINTEPTEDEREYKEPHWVPMAFSEGNGDVEDFKLLTKEDVYWRRNHGANVIYWQ